MSSLPVLSVPTFFLTVPSTKKKVKFRPFLSKEEKILMLVKQSESNEEVLQAMKDIIYVCTYEKLNGDNIALFDIEYIFLQLRSKSIGEIIEIDMKCTNEIELPKADDHPAGVDAETSSCDNLIPFSININDINVEFKEEHSNVITLENDIGITLRYPTVGDLKMIEDNSKDDVEIITNLIENVFTKDDVFDASETSREDIDEFMTNVSSKQIEDIRKKFFYNMPSLEYTAKYKCIKCGTESEYTFRGINDFF